ncbi:leucine-rich repeat domain-containing protein [Floridanema evergladense]|uniref:Leucine-rich repeat domain-containing protein n=1 Tax=Floridaenema evergladense BLCC-F167 TaxID=3153639 RepID=A0ABV4WMP5_9CYAN
MLDFEEVRQKATELHLSFKQLTSLPAQIGQLHSLIWIDLSQNQLTSLPAEIGQLNSLVVLNLSYNQLTSLPAEIGQLNSLVVLNLSCNQLTSLPVEIGQLYSLAELDLSYNQLTNLPPDIGQLHSLKELYLFNNKLNNLPAEIEELHSLKELNLDDNPIQDLSALANHPNQNLSVYCFEIELPRRYWTDLNQWKAEWLLTEENAEVRRVLIQQIGCYRIMQELGASAIDHYREYTLLKIDANIDIEPIHLLKMTCPSTGHIHVLRVPPNLTSARDAIRWVNWDIDPEAFAVET